MADDGGRDGVMKVDDPAALLAEAMARRAARLGLEAAAEERDWYEPALALLRRDAGRADGRGVAR